MNSTLCSQRHPAKQEGLIFKLALRLQGILKLMFAFYEKLYGVLCTSVGFRFFD